LWFVVTHVDTAASKEMKHQHSSTMFLAVASLVVGGAIICLRPVLFPTHRERLHRQLLVALSERNPTVSELAASYCLTYPDDPDSHWLAAEAATQQGDHAAAIGFYCQLPQDAGKWEFQRELGLGQRMFATGDLVNAEAHLRRAVEINPYHLEANNRLGHLLQVCGRAWESNRYFFTQIQRGKCRGDELLGAFASDRFFRHDERLHRMSAEPASPAFIAQLANAREALFDNRESDAEEILRNIVSAYPNLGEAQGRLGRIIVDRGDTSEFLAWRDGLLPDARTHPEVHFIEGLQLRKSGQIEGAIHCFLETLALSSDHLGATLQLASCFELSGRTELAARYSERAVLISEIDRQYNVLRSSFSQDMAMETAELLGRLGRYWEAAGWCFVISNLDSSDQKSRFEWQKWAARIEDSSSCGRAAGLDPALAASNFVAPRWNELKPSEKTDERKPASQQIDWKFHEEAHQRGINFSYFDGTVRATRLTHIFNTTGGGVGAIDFDMDGWIDLYLAQGNNWRQPHSEPKWIDRCFRNLGGERFEDVTAQTGLYETSYSQGVTVGDFNQDGFDDVYVSNLGPNTLYRNNGDGTFTDCTSEAGVAGNEWSTSSVLADFSGDGLPDLYVANYSRLKETAEKNCVTSDGVVKACTPDLVPAEFDRFYLNLGDGRFKDVSREAGILAPDGRGLGVVAWDFAGVGRLSLFVANDTSPNFLFQNQETGTDGIPRFIETGLVNGVALDGDGNAQASMGIAAGDVNGDGKIDLHVTNFFAESNTLYLGGDELGFTDATRRFHLRDPSFWMLGFGCQFADFDSDGWEDLVVTNGHVDQVSKTGSEDFMPPQLYANRKGKDFEAIEANQLGPFFQQKYLGRSLALLDWNRDGRTDFAVSHLHSPFALVTNRTGNAESTLVVRLIGRRGSRDATGAHVIAQIGDAAIHRLQTSGSGYLASNERLLHFSAPNTEKIDLLIVRWPDQHEQTWENVRTRQEILLIEDQSQPIVLKVYE
jgi:tetratricopeptide (TPR) repeat protein